LSEGCLLPINSKKEKQKRSVITRILRWADRHKWSMIIVPGFLLTTLVGYVGFSELSLISDGGNPHTSLDHLYMALQLFVLNGNPNLGGDNLAVVTARFLAPVVAAYAAVQALILIFFKQYQRLKIRIFYRQHVIICGLGAAGTLLVERFRQEDYPVVVIEQDLGNQAIEQAQQCGAVVLIGNANDPVVLTEAGVQRACTIIAVCGEDAMNAEIANRCAQLAHPKHLLKCFAQILNSHLCHYLSGHAFTSYTDDYFQLEFFNIYNSAARILLGEDPWLHNSYTKSSPPHVLVIGMNTLGQSLVIRAEQLWRSSFLKTGVQLHVTMLDNNAQEQWNLLCLEHPHLEQTCQPHAINCDVDSPTLMTKWPGRGQNDLKGISRIYLCLEEDQISITLAFMLLQRTRHLQLPIMICLFGYSGLVGLLEEKDEGKLLNAFGIVDRTCTPSLLCESLYEDLAITIHNQYMIRELEKGRDPADPSIAPWFAPAGQSSLGEPFKESNRRQARTIGTRLWRVGYGIEPLSSDGENEFDFDNKKAVLRDNGRQETELEFLARLEHESWSEQKTNEGYQAGLVRDEGTKRNPFLYPWYDERLPEEAHRLTRDIVQTWPGLLDSVDLQIFRVIGHGEVH